MSWRPHGHARVDPDNPEPAAVCDRCGNLWNHSELAWQYDWIGQKLQNRHILICPDCMDMPSMFMKTIILPPDPPPVFNIRPEDFIIDSISNWTIASPPGVNMFEVKSDMLIILTKTP